MTEQIAIELIECYKQDGSEATKAKAVDALGAYLYTNLHRFKLEFLTEDSRGDFIVALYPRLSRLIDQFDPTRAKFGTYIRWIVRYAYRTFLRKQYGYEARQRVYETEETSRLLCAETEEVVDTVTPYTEAAFPEGLSDKQKEIHARKIFLLACKSGLFVDDAAIGKIVRFTGYEESYVRSCIELIRETHRHRLDRLRSEGERQNGFYIRSQRCQYEMKYLDRETARYHALEREYHYCQRRWKDLRERNSRQIRSPSNRFLSGALGISRSTIDATLASAANEVYGSTS